MDSNPPCLFLTFPVALLLIVWIGAWLQGKLLFTYWSKTCKRLSIEWSNMLISTGLNGLLSKGIGCMLSSNHTDNTHWGVILAKNYLHGILGHFGLWTGLVLWPINYIFLQMLTYIIPSMSPFKEACGWSTCAATHSYSCHGSGSFAYGTSCHPG